MDGMLRVLEETRDLQREIRDLLLPKENLSLVLSSTTTDWSTNFSPPLHLNPKKNYELALVNLETYYTIPNIDPTNNTFVYSFDSGTTWKTVTLRLAAMKSNR